MKRRCVPLRADHKLLTPDTHTQSGVRLPVVQVRSEGVASLPGHLRDLSSNQSAVGQMQRRRPPNASPPRRLRFEDETETEAESRYLERQRRRAGSRGTGVLVSKPDLNLYVNGRAGQQGAGPAVDRQQREWALVGGTASGGGVNLNLYLHPPVPEERGRSVYRPRLNLLTEPIRETYIGSMTPRQTGGEGARDQVRTRANQVELNGNQTMPTTDLPINPYELTTPTQTVSKCPPSSPPSVMMSQSIWTNGMKAAKNKNQNHENDGTPAAVKPHRDPRPGAGLKERSPRVEDRGTKNSSSSSYSTSQMTAESQPPPTSDSSSDGQVRQPMRVELPSDELLIRRDESSRLSLRRLFSSVTLGRTRTGSLDRLSSRPPPSEPDPTPLCPRKSSGLLKKTLSVQTLSVQGSPFMQLKKSSSAQTCVSEQKKKKKKDRSAEGTPAADQVLQRCLSLEDVGRPSSVRSVGRVLQVCSDGTFLLEVHRPPKSRTFGFIIGRGRGRQDTGVYVEDMVDCGTEKLFAGLLAVGDEILEVNGEKVACLSLDQVSHLLTQNTSTTVRVLRHWTTSPR